MFLLRAEPAGLGEGHQPLAQTAPGQRLNKPTENRDRQARRLQINGDRAASVGAWTNPIVGDLSTIARSDAGVFDNRRDSNG